MLLALKGWRRIKSLKVLKISGLGAMRVDMRQTVGEVLKETVCLRKFVAFRSSGAFHAKDDSKYSVAIEPALVPRSLQLNGNAFRFLPPCLMKMKITELMLGNNRPEMPEVPLLMPRLMAICALLAVASTRAFACFRLRFARGHGKHLRCTGP